VGRVAKLGTLANSHNVMPYVSATAISGRPETAIRVVRDALVANSFTIVSANPTAFTATGPGMSSSNQNPLLGISKVSFRAEGGLIHVQADLGGASRLGLFAMVFPPALGVLLAAIFYLTQNQNPNAVVAPLGAVAPWLVLGPLMARWIRRRTEKAIHALLQSTASISETG
jgi:hypothetical protein